jgi:N-acetylglucosamine malate deacetylase 2
VTLLLAAHPDDEVIGAGGQMQWLAPALHVAHLTPGIPSALDPEQRATYHSPEAYGACRARELDAVLTRALIAPARCHRLNGADQRCSQMLMRLTCEFRDLLYRLTPDVLLTHPYEGGHPDHDAAAVIAQMACSLLPSPPVRLEFASYHIRDGRFECAAFLPNEDQGAPAHLGERQRAFKRALMTEYASQQRVLAQFAPDVERVRIAPEYDFSEPPHPPPLYYQRYPWGGDAYAFCGLAAAALAALRHLPETACH